MRNKKKRAKVTDVLDARCTAAEQTRAGSLIKRRLNESVTSIIMLRLAHSSAESYATKSDVLDTSSTPLSPLRIRDLQRNVPRTCQHTVSELPANTGVLSTFRQTLLMGLCL